MQETNDYAEHQCVDRGKQVSYRWSGCSVIDIAHFWGIMMWMGIVKPPEMRMFWTLSHDQFDAMKRYFHTFNCKAIPKENTDKLIIVRPVLDFLMEKCCTLYVPSKSLYLRVCQSEKVVSP